MYTISQAKEKKCKENREDLGEMNTAVFFLKTLMHVRAEVCLSVNKMRQKIGKIHNTASNEYNNPVEGLITSPKIIGL